MRLNYGLAANAASPQNGVAVEIRRRIDVEAAPRRHHAAKHAKSDPVTRQLLGRELSTVTARRFCDQQEMSLQVATGRSLP